MANLLQFVLVILLLVLGTTKLDAQLKVGSNPKTLAPNALFEIESTSGKSAIFTKDSAFLGIGTLTPTRRLEIQNSTPGAIKIVDGTQGLGKVLTSDANGVAIWATPFSVTPGNLTNSNGIIVTGGTGATLTATSLRLDSTAVAKMLGQSPVKDSVSTVVSNIITSGNITGQNATAGSLITVTGGTGASLKAMTIAADTNAMKSFVATNVNKSPIKDSLSTVINNQITTGTISGQNLTNSNGILVFGGTGTTIKATSLRLDSTAVAKMLGQSPVKDSVSTVVSNIITSGNITGQNTTAGSLITVTGGTGASLKSMTVAADTNAMKSFVATNVNKSPIKDSLSTVINNQITTGTISGQNLTNSNGILVFGGTGTTIKATSLRLDSTAVAKMLGQSPVKDSVSTVVSNIITTGNITGQNATAGSLITVTGGTGASLKTMTVSVDTSALKTFTSARTTNTLSSAVNTITSTVNGIVATVPAVNTVSNTFNSTTRALTTTVNGVAGTSVTLTDGPDSTTASNGLTLTGKDVRLGGSLTAATTVTTSATNTLALAGLQSGAATDSIMVINPANNVIRNVSLATLLNANNIVSTQTITVPALSIGDAGSVTVTIAGATTTSSVVVNPVNDMPNGVAIAYARVSAANTVKIGFIGSGSSASFSSDFLIRVIK